MKADYDLIAAQWCQLRTSLPAKDQGLFDFFYARLPEGADILDLACGSGIPIARQLAEKGHRLVCADRSQKLLQQARQNVPGARFQHSELEQLDIAALAGQAFDCGRGYDAVVFWDAIFHLPRQAHRAILEKVIAALATGGQLIVSSGGSEQDLAAFTDTMFGVSFYYDAYSRGEFLLLCQSIGFSVEKVVVVNEPDGLRDKGRIGVVLAKV